jgi:sec-independent protein translocase protein TatB
MLSIPHMIVVFIVVLVVFGPQKLPELARGLGKLMAEFRKASTDFKSAFEEEMREMERQALQAERKKAAEAVAASAAAEPSAPLAPAGSADAETPPSEVHTETRATEDLVVSPVVESVPRSSEEPAETKTEGPTITSSQEPPHDNQHPA